ncbi:preprotein translocase subunit SecY [Haloglycomyces albus]|uniref:preprotein translocase subunit SecY n=1 Tax=Haloglycomyces albus TaxID=526067 RepID=UPI00046D58C0|nr:preprotein translocase subunit SecY [Haloglycomyces albus]
MLSAFVSAFKTPDLRKKILFTLFIIALYRLGAQTPSPGIDYATVQACIAPLQDADSDSAGVFGILNLFTGGALLQLSVFALGVMPYITASIIMQLLTVVIPRLEQLRKEGQPGQAKINQYTRYLTVGLATLQAAGYIALARNGTLMGADCPGMLPNLSDQGIPFWLSIVTVVAVMVAGTTMIMWFGEQVTERGVGNGMSLMIFASIASALPGQFWTLQQTEGWFLFGIIVVVGIAIMVAVVFIEQSQRRIPVQYAKKMVGRRMYGGTNTYIPIKVNQAGIIPVIFGSSLLYIPTLLLQLNQGSDSAWVSFVSTYLTDQGSWVYISMYALMIIFFTYFYVSITFRADDIADNMKKAGGFVPGVRPGKPTASYLQQVLSRLTFPGSIYLALIAILPNLAIVIMGNQDLFAQFPFGGTSVLIMVGVGLESVRQIESQLEQRHYQGFLR